MGKKLEKLNPQASARQEKLLLSCVKPPESHIFISRDLAAGEPTVICHYSQDHNYHDAAFGMQGKLPYYAGDLLKINDIYLTGMSFSPMHSGLMRELFHTKFGTISFSEQWLIDKEVILGQVKKQRKLSKIMVLGLGYSMGPKKMVKQAYDAGYTVTLPQAQEFFKNYWLWAADVKRFGDRMSKLFKQQGYLVNQFGFRLTPDKDYKALNYMIQSSVSGLMNVLIPQILTACPHEKFVGIIHDELISYGPKSLVDTSKSGTILAQKQLNETLKWRVPMQVGFVTGNNLYEAK